MTKLDRSCRNCREALRLQLGGELPSRQRAAMEQHVASCTACRDYSAQLRAASAGLRRLAAAPVEPNPGFHARWTSAVAELSQPGPVAQRVAAWIGWSQRTLLQNRRMLAALAPVWILVLVFKLTAPEVGKLPSATLACSPMDLFRALTVSGDGIMAFERRVDKPSPAKTRTNSPGGGRATTRPMTLRNELEVDPLALYLS